MKLLLDQNISHRIIPKLIEYFPEVKQVRQLGLENIQDSFIWNYARENDYSIVSFDADFFDLSIIRGFPPKIIWLRIGNTNTNNLADVIINNTRHITDFVNEADFGCLEIN